MGQGNDTTGISIGNGDFMGIPIPDPIARPMLSPSPLSTLAAGAFSTTLPVRYEQEIREAT